MKTWSKIIPVFLGIWGWVLATAAPAADEAAIQAVQQASDPSSAVAAFANGFAVDRNNPKLYEAYITRMVDLGLPELAYHQAEALTTLQANNRLAWGVVGYVNARRGDMPAAISAIVLAGQTAPDSQFVQRTAGEILAWYDLKADKSQIADNTKNGLAAIRARFGTSAVFTQAYDTARQAYLAQTRAEQTPTQAAPTQPANQAQPYSTTPGGYGEVNPVYYNNYYYDWGPGWVEPAPWWWWRPVGFFAGFNFCPFPAVFVFDHHNFFEHRHPFVHDHDKAFFHHGVNDRFSKNDQVVWHRDANGRANFFGTPARPNVALTQQATTMASVPRVTSFNSGVRPGPVAANRTTPMAPVAAPQTIPQRVAPAVTPPMAARPAPQTMARPMAPTMVQPAAPTMVRPTPSGGAAAPSHQSFATARPSGGGTHHGGR